jgi:hypothetical protein
VKLESNTRFRWSCIGYDVREPITVPWTWDDETKALYLLRTDVLKPLSTDDNVWPHPALSTGNLSLMGLLNNAFGLSNYLKPLCQTFSAALPPNAWTPVAFHALVDAQYDHEGRLFERLALLPHILPSESLKSGKIIGFDVSDLSLLSGLMDCGYNDPIGDQRFLSWANRLNQYHLFSDVTDATAFRNATNHRVREHAPFFVYAVEILEPEVSISA